MTRSGPAAGAVTGRGRAARVVLLGGSSLLLATAAHTLGGGTLPSPAVLGVTGFLLGLVALLLTTRRARFPVLLAGLTVQQLLLHLLFDAAASAAACTSTAGLHHGMTGLSCRDAMTAMTDGGAMLTAHVVATVATAWLLARGEAWWFRAADRVVRAAGAAVAVHRVTRRPRPVSRLAVVVAPTGPADLAAPRGPPPVLV